MFRHDISRLMIYAALKRRGTIVARRRLGRMWVWSAHALYPSSESPSAVPGNIETSKADCASLICFVRASS